MRIFGDTRISYLFDKYSPASEALCTRQETFNGVEV